MEVRDVRGQGWRSGLEVRDVKGQGWRSGMSEVRDGGQGWRSGVSEVRVGGQGCQRSGVEGWGAWRRGGDVRGGGQLPGGQAPPASAALSSDSRLCVSAWPGHRPVSSLDTEWVCCRWGDCLHQQAPREGGSPP